MVPHGREGRGGGGGGGGKVVFLPLTINTNDCDQIRAALKRGTRAETNVLL